MIEYLTWFWWLLDNISYQVYIVLFLTWLSPFWKWYLYIKNSYITKLEKEKENFRIQTNEVEKIKMQLKIDRKKLDDRVALYNLEARRKEFEIMMYEERERLNSEKSMYKDDLNIQYQDKLSKSKEDSRKEYQNEMEKFKHQLESEIQFVNNQQLLNENRIKLNVGGHHYTTTLTTLRSYPDSMLAAMFSGRFSLKLDEDGEYFIDRNGKVFEIILDWLRTGVQPNITDPDLSKRVALESSYYGLN